MMFFDIPVRFQMSLQDSATYGMEMIVQLHNYVMLINVFIISVVIWFFFEIIAVMGFLQWFSYGITVLNLRKKKFFLGQVIYKQLKKAMLHMPTLEVVWTLLPVVALISIALPSLSMLYYFSLSFTPLLTLQVIGHQWYWSYEYAVPPLVNADLIELVYETSLGYDSIMKQTEDLSYGSLRILEVDKPLFLPVDVPIRVIVSSDDVLHSWAVPSLGIKIDCVPGRLNVVDFKISRAGIFYGQCSEICGTQHGFMPICIVAISPKTFFNTYGSF